MPRADGTRKPLTEEQRLRQNKNTKTHTAKRRAEGLEDQHTVWVRTDVWASIKNFQAEYKEKHGKRITFRDLMNEALFDLVLKKRQELIHGEPIEFKDTYYDPTTKETKRNPI